jgi:hypothetical protein
VKLREIAERKEYAELVKDITPKKQVEEPFSSYKDQLGFGKHCRSVTLFLEKYYTLLKILLFLQTRFIGLHVGLTMFTGYLVGYASFRALFNRNPALVSLILSDSENHQEDFCESCFSFPFRVLLVGFLD